MIRFFYIAVLGILVSCLSREPAFDSYEPALEHGRLAREGMIRCRQYMQDWLEFADPETGLIPRNLYRSSDIWNAQDAAADNYPFMVLTAALTDPGLFEGRMREMLETETELTSRIYALPDTWSFSKDDFAQSRIDTASIIFGSSEYIKDGLLPLTEWLGPSPWSGRMISIMDDIWRIAPVETPYGAIPSTNPEVNGEMLQALSRIYWMTGDRKYLEWAIRLGDYYLLGDQHPTDDLSRLRLRDHGCEVVSGLCELYVTFHAVNQKKKKVYREPLYRMLDRILETGRNPDGMFYNNIDPQTGEVIGQGAELDRVADTWGYTYNGYYAVYLVDHTERYREAVVHVLGHLDPYRNYDWESGSADGYADAIESALNLYNREPVDGAADWIDSEMQVMWSMQDSSPRDRNGRWVNSGIIEGWHGDGNFARTTLMYCLWKTQGIYFHPWRKDISLGAERDGHLVRIALELDAPWEGKIYFDRKRHHDFLHLPLDYPRINQFPEWYPVSAKKQYRIIDLKRRRSREYAGDKLIDGIAMHFEEPGRYFFQVEEITDE